MVHPFSPKDAILVKILFDLSSWLDTTILLYLMAIINSYRQSPVIHFMFSEEENQLSANT